MGQATELEHADGRFSPLRAERLYFLSVIILGMFLLVFSFRTLSGENHLNGWDIVVFALLSILAEQTYVNLPHGSKISASFSVLLTALILFNIPITILLACLGNAFTVLLVQKRNWRIAVFNMGQYAISYGLAGLALQFVHHQADRMLTSLPLLHTMFAAGAATLVYLVVNLPLVNGFVAIRNLPDLTRQRFFRSLLVFQEDKVEITQTLFFFPIAVMVASFYQKDHNLVILGVLMALILGGLRFIEQRRRMEEQNEKLRTLYELNKQMGESILREAEVEITHRQLFENLLDQRGYQQISKVIPNQRCSVYRVERLGEDWRIVHERSDQIPEPEKNFHMEDEGPLQDIVCSKRGVILNHLGHLSLPYVLWKKAYKALIAQPILVDDNVAYLLVLFRVNLEPFHERDERMLKLLVQPLEITLKNIQLRTKIQEQAIRDGLMGVFNHRYLKNKMEEELSRSKRYKNPLSLVICDVDYFKKFNDTHGHLLGDKVLQEIAAILKDSVRETDIVARYGGEELAVLLPETPLKAACEVAERIRSNVARYAFTGKDEQVVSLSLSIGVTCTDDTPDLQVSELIVRADTALYKAKNQGRNQISKAVVEKGKLIIETYSRGQQPLSASSVPVEVPGLRSETRQILLSSLEQGKPAFVKQLQNFVQSQKNLPAAYQQYFIDTILPQLPELLRVYLQSSRDTRGEGAWGESIAQVLHGWQKSIRHKLQGRDQAVILNEICLQAYRYFMDQALSVPLTEIEKKYIFEIWYAFFRETSQVLLHNSFTYLEEQRSQTQHLLEAVRHLNLFQSGQNSLEDTMGRILPQLHQILPQTEGVLLAFPGQISGQYLTRVILGLSPRTSAALQNQLAFRWPLPGLSPLQFSESAQPERWGEVRELLDQHVPGVQALVYRPITHQRQVKALMVLLMNHSTPLGNRQIRWLKTFGDELSFALVHREQGQEMERRTLRVLRQMVDIFESGSDPWSFHSERVSSLAGRLALRLGLSEYEQQELRELAYLYSLGRLVQPTELKNSPDQLQHALLGSRILESVPHLAHLAPSLRHFGEHWDGSGFPDGLAGIQIPLYSRIIGLAQACESGRRPELSSGRLVETLSKTGYYDPSLCTLLKDMVEADEIKV